MNAATFQVYAIPRLEADLRISSEPPNPLPLERPIGRNAFQNEILHKHIAILQKDFGISEFEMRVNQQQVNAAGTRVGINRPDLQFTYKDQCSILNTSPLAQREGYLTLSAFELTILMQECLL